MSRKLFNIAKKIWIGSGVKNAFNVNVRRKANGVSYRVPIIRGMGLANLELSEKWMLDVLSLMAWQGGSFVDVGVNVGQTLIKVKSVWPEWDYIGFEPNPACVFYVNSLIAINEYQSCRVIPCGIYKETRIMELSFFSTSDVGSNASLVDKLRTDKTVYRKENVAVLGFGDIVRNINLADVRVLKIDVEGAELEVCDTLMPLIEKDKPYVLMEFLPIPGNDVEHDAYRRQLMLEQLMHDMGYSTYRINKNNKGGLHDIERIQNIGLVPSVKDADYLFIHADAQNERLEKFQRGNESCSPVIN